MELSELSYDGLKDLLSDVKEVMEDLHAHDPSRTDKELWNLLYDKEIELRKELNSRIERRREARLGRINDKNAAMDFSKLDTRALLNKLEEAIEVIDETKGDESQRARHKRFLDYKKKIEDELDSRTTLGVKASVKK